MDFVKMFNAKCIRSREREKEYAKKHKAGEVKTYKLPENERKKYGPPKNKKNIPLILDKNWFNANLVAKRRGENEVS